MAFKALLASFVLGCVMASDPEAISPEALFADNECDDVGVGDCSVNALRAQVKLREHGQGVANEPRNDFSQEVLLTQLFLQLCIYTSLGVSTPRTTPL